MYIPNTARKKEEKQKPSGACVAGVQNEGSGQTEEEHRKTRPGNIYAKRQTTGYSENGNDDYFDGNDWKINGAQNDSKKCVPCADCERENMSTLQKVPKNYYSWLSQLADNLFRKSISNFH